VDGLWLDVASVRRPLLGFVLGLLLASLLAVVGPRPVFAVPPKPATDWSFYVRTTSNDALYDLGCNQGNYDAAHNVNSEVILDFGGQASNNAGTLLTVINTYVSYGTVEGLAEQFAKGYYICTGLDRTTVLDLNVGTNNSAYYVDETGGSTWSNVVNAVNNWVNGNNYASQVFVGGASDMEPGYDTQTRTINWINGYAGNHGRYFLDYGSTDGCPQTSHNNGGCNNGWNQYGIWYVSWGAGPAWPLPEIYYQSQTNQWVQVDLYGTHSQNSTMSFIGPLDEHDLDSSTFDGSAAWDSLWNGLSGGGEIASMPFSAEVHIAS
jgi:hypothetical protein